MTTRLLLAILVVLSLAASGCSGNRRVCRRIFNDSHNCQRCCQPMCNCNCGCSSCGMTNCSMGGCSCGSGGMCSACDCGSCPTCSGASFSGYGGEMIEGDSFGPTGGGYFESAGSPPCNCGSP